MDKLTLICKPEQSGKTAVMIEYINKKRITDNHHCTKTAVNIIFSDNNLLLTKQTASRVGSGVYKLPGTDQNYVELSSRKHDTVINHVTDVLHAILFKHVNNIICCTNRTRVNDIVSLINTMNTDPSTYNKFSFVIWLDEADKFINTVDRDFIPLCQQYVNIDCVLITATPDRLFDKYEYIRVLPLETTINSTYHGWNDNDIYILENDTGTRAGFVHQVVDTVDIIKGSKWFIPANITTASHKVVADVLTENGFAVITVNGRGIYLTLPSCSIPRIFAKRKELQYHISYIYNRYNLDRFPVAVTGNICIGRGVSIMHPGFQFDNAILSECTTNAETSQLAGRIKGNIKRWANYKIPVVYTTRIFHNIASEWEDKSRKLARYAFDNNPCNEETVVVSKQVYENIGVPENDIK